MFVARKITFKTLLFTTLLSFSALLFAVDLPPLTHGLTPVEPKAAPALKFEDMDEEMVNLVDLKGKVVVVNFWATWCPPCRREMGSLERLHLATADKDVVVLAVNIGEDVDTVFPFIGTVDPAPTFPILFDLDSASMEPWKVRGLPTTYIINPQGEIAYRAIGGREFDHPELIKKVLSLHE